MKKEFVDIDINNRSDKIALTKHIYGRLDEIFGISLIPKTKKPTDKRRLISGLGVYDIHNIIFKTEESKLTGGIGNESVFIDDEDIVWEE